MMNGRLLLKKLLENCSEEKLLSYLEKTDPSNGSVFGYSKTEMVQQLLSYIIDGIHQEYDEEKVDNFLSGHIKEIADEVSCYINQELLPDLEHHIKNIIIQRYGDKKTC